jgi:hypothetical protein
MNIIFTNFLFASHMTSVSDPDRIHFTYPQILKYPTGLGSHHHQKWVSNFLEVSQKFFYQKAGQNI